MRRTIWPVLLGLMGCLQYLHQYQRGSLSQLHPLPRTVRGVFSSWPKTWWTAGWNSREERATNLLQLILRWDERLVVEFQQAWHDMQQVSHCANLVKVYRYDWGLFSTLRDLGTNIVRAFFEGRAVVLESMRPSKTYCLPEISEDQYIGCYFSPLLSCPQIPDDSPLYLSIEAWEGSLRVPMLQQWIEEGRIWWESLGGVRYAVEVWNTDEKTFSWPVHSMIRSLLFTTLWKPNARLQSRVSWLSNAVQLSHPVLILHIRRTDKLIDLGVVNVRLRWADQNIPLSTYGKMIRGLEASLSISFNSVYLLTDDLDAWKNRSQWMVGFSSRSVRPVINPYWLEHAKLFRTDAWKTQGHSLLNFTGPEPTIDNFHLNLLSDVVFAAQEGDYLIGCGASGVSQLIAQGMGARLHMDGNWLAWWEEDFLHAS